MKILTIVVWALVVLPVKNQPKGCYPEDYGYHEWQFERPSTQLVKFSPEYQKACYAVSIASKTVNITVVDEAFASAMKKEERELCLGKHKEYQEWLDCVDRAQVLLMDPDSWCTSYKRKVLEVCP